MQAATVVYVTENAAATAAVSILDTFFNLYPYAILLRVIPANLRMPNSSARVATTDKIGGFASYRSNLCGNFGLVCLSYFAPMIPLPTVLQVCLSNARSTPHPLKLVVMLKAVQSHSPGLGPRFVVKGKVFCLFWWRCGISEWLCHPN